MKKYIFSLIAMAFGVMNAFAQTVKVDDVTIKAGETKVVSINLSNSQSNIVSFQMDLTLPDGITLNKAGCGLGSRITDNDQELTIGKQPNGDYRLTSTSFALKPISGSTGEIIELSLTAASNAKGGTASLKNILFATSNSESLTADNTTFKVNPTYTLTYILDGQVYRTENLVYGTPIDPEPALKKTGYTFSGWSEIPETMPNHDVTVTGSFTINSYTLTYKVDGQIYKTSTVVYGTAITPETEPTKEGYTFSGWNGLPETMPANDVEVTGTFTINSYTLTYIVDGEVYKKESIVYGTSIEPEPALEKTGYTFSGWSEIPATMPAHDVTVTGAFTINSYTLTYKVDGQVYKTSTVVYGTAITPEAEPTKEGYTFSGWNGLPETMPANDVEVTGTFSINSYTLTYIVDGEVYKTESIVYGTSIDPEPALKKTGYTFSGWSEIPATMPAHDVTVTGSFTINKYKMTYIVDGAEYKSYEIDYGTAITPEPAPTKEGHTFSGWSDIPATMPAHDVTVTGTFSINSYKLTYLLNGEEYLSETVVYGTPLTPEPALQKEGYTFSGWSGLPETMPAHDVTVTGTLTVNNYKLTYKVDGAVYKTLTVAYGTAITPEPAPTKEGHTFSGWSEIPATMPAHDVEVNGTFSINSYTLTYILDGSVYKTETVVYGTPLTPEPALQKEGYTFSGWSEIPTTMPAHDVTVTGSFSINSYKLTYKVDGVVYKTSTVVYGTPITPEAEPTKEGYTFSGWSEIPSTMPAHDVTVTGSFTINSYTLTYKVDGETYKTSTVVYGTAITPEANPTKEGYTFSGWSEIPDKMPAHDVVVTGSFSINSYTLTYKVDGVVYKTSTVVYGTALTPEAEPTKEGYTFNGWSEIPATMPAHDVTVTGTFTVNNYTLTYIVDGKEYKTSTIAYGTAITPEANPSKEGYTFSGWSETPAIMPAHDVTVTGSFTINKYKLTYIVDGAEYKSYEIDYASAITPEATPTKEGHTFSGWSDIPATMPAHDVTITGTFTINSYKLTYKVDGAEYKTLTVTYGTIITPEPVPTKEGHTFSGWSEIPATMPAHDVTVIGSFTINSYKLTYKVDGEVYKTMTIAYGTDITPEPLPTKEGHTFSGWSEIPETMPSHDVEVNGTFSINSYTLTYKVDGETYKTSTVVYGTAITPEPAPTKEGHTFSGWSTIPATMPAHDVVVTGSFTVNNYILTYIVDGKEYKTSSVAYGTAITPEAAPTKEGYTFSGWSEIPATMPAHDVTVTGTFSINSYTLTYKVDGVVYKTSAVVYGTAITPEPEPVKEGHTFSGWSEIPETMPAHDVTVTGSFAINSYKLTYKVDGVVYKTSTVVYGTALTPEAEPTKEGYTFSGWSEIPATMPAHDVTITGTFTINSYKLTYKVDGDVYKTMSVVYGTTITPEPAPTKEGYTFSGWSEIPATMPAHDVTVTGIFSINSYTLTYKVDGEVYKTSTVVYGTAITPEAEPTKEGYTFSGWSEIPKTMPAHDVEVTGMFSINSYTLTYKVDGKIYKTSTVVYGTAITPEPAPTKEGHTFSGWSTIPATMPAHDVVVTGNFTVNNYILTYIVDGKEYKTSSVAYGTAITPEAAPTKEGYTFSGWSEIPATMPAHDVTVTGTFSINSYTLTYKVDGVVYKTSTVVYGTAITPEPAPTKEGHTFSGWSEVPKTMPAHDVVVTGSFSINQYILAYILDGEAYKSYKLDYNTPIRPEIMPVKKGMTFSGWGNVPEKMPAHDVTLTGSYSWSRETYDYVIYQVADTLNNYASVVGYSGTDDEVEILPEVIIGEDTYTVHGIAEDALPEAVTICVPVGKLLLWLWEDGYENLKETGSGRSLASPELSLVGATASSLTMSFTNEIAEFGETVTLLDEPVEKGDKGYDLTLKGLEPNKLYEGVATFTLTFEDVAYTKTYSFSTEALTLTTQQPKVVSLGNVIVAAESNIDEKETNVGFEWRRTDWTDDFTSNSGEAYLYEGMMEGYIQNLNTEKLWKYRPYYEANSGNRYYGEWVGIDPTDFSYFEPIVHTSSSVTVTNNSVEVKGFAMQGTDNVTSQGFMYWSTYSASSLRKVSGIPDDAQTVLVSGYVMTVILEGLEYETEYCCVAFVKTTEGETFYGEPQIFRTGEMDPDGIEEIKNEELRMKNEGVWYSLDGKKLSKPQKGINIIRYSDGSSKKVLMK